MKKTTMKNFIPSCFWFTILWLLLLTCWPESLLLRFWDLWIGSRFQKIMKMKPAVTLYHLSTFMLYSWNAPFTCNSWATRMKQKEWWERSGDFSPIDLKVSYVGHKGPVIYRAPPLSFSPHLPKRPRTDSGVSKRDEARWWANTDTGRHTERSLAFRLSFQRSIGLEIHRSILKLVLLDRLGASEHFEHRHFKQLQLSCEFFFRF